MKIFNELEYAEKLLQHGFTKSQTKGELIILAKYYRYTGVENFEELKNKIIEFCKKYNKEFVEYIYIDDIEYAIRRSEKNSLRIPQDIPITRNELERIRSLKNYRYEKVLFILLVLGKYFKITNTGKKSTSSTYYIPSMPFNNIFRLAHVTQKKNENILYYLYKNEFIGNNYVTDSIFLKFTNVEDNSDVEFYVTNINDIIKFYPKYCLICGKKIEDNKKYHLECFKEKERNRARG